MKAPLALKKTILPLHPPNLRFHLFKSGKDSSKYIFISGSPTWLDPTFPTSNNSPS